MILHPWHECTPLLLTLGLAKLTNKTCHGLWKRVPDIGPKNRLQGSIVQMWDTKADTSVQLSSCGLTFWVTFGVRKRSRQESVCVYRWLSWNWKPRGFSWSRRMLLTQAHHLKPCSASNSRSACLACMPCQFGRGVYLRLHCQLSSIACKSAHLQSTAMAMATAHLHS